MPAVSSDLIIDTELVPHVWLLQLVRHARED